MLKDTPPSEKVTYLASGTTIPAWPCFPPPRSVETLDAIFVSSRSRRVIESLSGCPSILDTGLSSNFLNVFLDSHDSVLFPCFPPQIGWLFLVS